MLFYVIDLICIVLVPLSWCLFEQKRHRPHKCFFLILILILIVFSTNLRQQLVPAGLEEHREQHLGDVERVIPAVNVVVVVVVVKQLDLLE
jgi:hypothetical protein